MYIEKDKTYWIGSIDTFKRCTGKGYIKYPGDNDFQEIDVIGFESKYYYQGEINNVNLPHGFGIILTFNNKKYIGIFDNGEFCGFFNIKTSNSEYNGYLFKNIFTGPGYFLSKNKIHFLFSGQTVLMKQ